MPRDLNARENEKRAKAKRQRALDRGEFRGPSQSRAPTTAPTSFPLKAPVDAATHRMIDEEIARRRAS